MSSLLWDLLEHVLAGRTDRELLARSSWDPLLPTESENLTAVHRGLEKVLVADVVGETIVIARLGYLSRFCRLNRFYSLLAHSR